MSVCGAANPWPDLPACEREEHSDPNHEATWFEDGGTSHMRWQDAETIREALRPQRDLARQYARDEREPND